MNTTDQNFVNSIFLRRSMKVIISPEAVHDTSSTLNIAYLGSFLKNLESLGYTLSVDAIKALSNVSVDTCSIVYNSIVNQLRTMTGANKSWVPMYRNFPQQVMEASDAELYVTAMMHYIGDLIGLRIMPDHEKKARFPLIGNYNLKVINLGTEAEFRSMMKNLMGAKTSISETDKEDITSVIKHFGNNVIDMLPNEVTHKENLAYIASVLLAYTNLTSKITSMFNSVTDVLRLATAMSNGDVSLATNTKFRNFTRSERKAFMEMINSMNNVQEDMLRNKGRWIRLSERLHPSEDRYLKYGVAVTAFNALREGDKISTFGGVIETALVSKDIKVAVTKLKRRPGELARRLDHLLRMSKTRTEQNMVVDAFISVTEKVATPVLLQVMSHFNHRNSDGLRVIFPKGNVANVMALENDLPVISESICLQIVSACENAMRARFSSLEPMGKVYIDSSMKGMIVPFSQRSASRTLRTIVRGSRIKLEEGKNTARFFLWWHDLDNGRVDVDLSAMMYNSDWNYVDHISYTNLRSQYDGVIACHSGDITSAPQGACEFIDIDLDSVARNGGQYIVMNVISFTGQKFSEMPECFAGWMMRTAPQSGEIFDAKTVQNKIDLTSESRYSIPLVIDVVNREIIWGDLALNKDPRSSVYNSPHSPRSYSGRNVENMKGSVTLLGKSITSMKKATIHELMTLHASARGTIVDNKEDADIVVSMDGNITPFDIEKIMGEYL